VFKANQTQHFTEKNIIYTLFCPWHRCRSIMRISSCICAISYKIQHN